MTRVPSGLGSRFQPHGNRPRRYHCRRPQKKAGGTKSLCSASKQACMTSHLTDALNVSGRLFRCMISSSLGSRSGSRTALTALAISLQRSNCSRWHLNNAPLRALALSLCSRCHVFELHHSIASCQHEATNTLLSDTGLPTLMNQSSTFSWSMNAAVAAFNCPSRCKYLKAGYTRDLTVVTLALPKHRVSGKIKGVGSL